ncbi:unnamed protein product [Durusdinium trenchii]|uniref:Uncharacterized protein n=1 Tax=Durusdinium trenchii TaxID=1381693 RepID=A0ABP0Q493_9DINO
MLRAAQLAQGSGPSAGGHAMCPASQFHMRSLVGMPWAKWALFLQLASRVHGVREGLIWAENDTEILQPLQKKGLEDVFRMMEDKYSFKVGLQRALEEAREKKEGLCPRKGKWKQMGCAPFRTELAALKCNCRPYLGILARECVNHTEIYGDFEDKLEYRTARQLYAGKCEFSKQFHEAALALVLVIIVSTALWCVLSGRAANELDEPEEEGQAQQLDAEEGQQREEDEMRQRDEKRRGDLFSDLVRDSKNLHALAMKISALPPPPNSEAFTPIKSNIYRYWALGGKKRSWLHYLGLRFVLVIQLLAPLAILRQGFYRYNWSSTEIHFVNYVYGDLTYGGSHVLGRVLEFAFTYCIGLHCLSIIKKASTENSMLSSLFDELRRQKDARDAGTGSRESYVSRWSQTCLFLDCAMICYVILVGLVDMVLVFTMSEGPKDICFDSLGLLFIFHLHEVDGGLSFVSVKDFNQDRIGELCHRLAESTERDVAEGSFSSSERRTVAETKRLKFLAQQRIKQRSALFFVTEMAIYIILFLVPVFQLFVQDGLQGRSTGTDQGTLGAHIVQDEALIYNALKKLPQS